MDSPRGRGSIGGWWGIKTIDPFYAVEMANKVLEDFDDVCGVLGIRYCLILGTCLGFYRDGRYILCDNDIDVWVVSNPPGDESFAVAFNFPALVTRLESIGFVPDGLQHFYRDNILLDIWRTVFSTTVAPSSFVESFDTIVYNGRTYNLPHPVEGYLECKYGPDWRKHKPRC